MSVTSNLCCDETEPRRIHSPDTYKPQMQIHTEKINRFSVQPEKKIKISYKGRAIKVITDFSKNNGYQKTEYIDCWLKKRFFSPKSAFTAK